MTTAKAQKTLPTTTTDRLTLFQKCSSRTERLYNYYILRKDYIIFIIHTVYFCFLLIINLILTLNQSQRSACINRKLSVNIVFQLFSFLPSVNKIICQFVTSAPDDKVFNNHVSKIISVIVNHDLSNYSYNIANNMHLFSYIS